MVRFSYLAGLLLNFEVTLRLAFIFYMSWSNMSKAIFVSFMKKPRELLRASYRTPT
jgi:hypothetical protein